MSEDMLFPVVDEQEKDLAQKVAPKKGTQDATSETNKLNRQAQTELEKNALSKKAKMKAFWISIIFIILGIVGGLVYFLVFGSSGNNPEFEDVQIQSLSVETDNIDASKLAFRVDYLPHVKNSLDEKNIFEEAYDLVFEELENAGFSSRVSGDFYFTIEIQKVGISNMKANINTKDYSFNFFLKFHPGPLMSKHRPTMFDSLSEDKTKRIDIRKISSIKVPREQLIFKNDGKVRKIEIEDDYKVIVQKKIYNSVKADLDHFISILE